MKENKCRCGKCKDGIINFSHEIKLDGLYVTIKRCDKCNHQYENVQKLFSLEIIKS